MAFSTFCYSPLKSASPHDLENASNPKAQAFSRFFRLRPLLLILAGLVSFSLVSYAFFSDSFRTRINTKEWITGFKEYGYLAPVREQLLPYIWRSEPADNHHLAEEFIMMIPANKGMLPMAYNLMCSLKRIKAPVRPIVWALDMDAVKALHDYRSKHGGTFGIYHDPSLFSVSSFEPGGTGNYWKMMAQRPKYFLSMLRDAKINLLFVDADIVFYSDPWDIVRESNGADFSISTDARNFYDLLDDPYEGQATVPKICAGLFSVRANERTARLYDEMTHLISRGFNDQNALDHLLNYSFNATLIPPLPYGLPPQPKPHPQDTSLPPISVHLLSQTTYVNGAIYIPHRTEEYERRVRDQNRGKKGVVHGNWWGSDKFQDFKAYGLWLLDDGNRCIEH